MIPRDEDSRPTVPAPWEGAPPCMHLGCTFVALPGSTRCQVHRQKQLSSAPPSRHVTYTLLFDRQRIPLRRAEAAKYLAKVIQRTDAPRGSRFYVLPNATLVVRVTP